MKSQLNQNRTMESFMLDTFLLPSFFQIIILCVTFWCFRYFTIIMVHQRFSFHCLIIYYVILTVRLSVCLASIIFRDVYCIASLEKIFYLERKYCFAQKNHQHISKYRTRDISKLFVIFFWRIFVTKISKIF